MCVGTEELGIWWWISGCVVMVLWNSLFGSSLLSDERLVDVRNDTTTSDGGLDQAVEFFVSANSELEMARCDTFDFQILGSVTSQLENLKKDEGKLEQCICRNGHFVQNIGWIGVCEQKIQKQNIRS